MNEKTSSTSTTQRIVGTAPRYNRKKVAGVGALAFAGLFAGGWIEGVPRIEKDLERRTEAKLIEAGFTGVEASFSGQDGTLRCATPLTDAERSKIVRLSEGKWGVRVAEFDESCSGEASPVAAATTTTVVASTTSTEPAATTTENTDTIEPVVDIPTVAAGTADFSTLTSLLQSAGLIETLQGDGPFTVFAPTNAAFDKVDPATLAALQADPEALKRVLTYHVVPGALRADDLASGALATVDGADLDVQVAGGSGVITINGAEVTKADIPATNGVIHAIDTVLIPADLDLGGAAAQGSAVATYTDGRIVLTGTVATEAQKQAMFDAAAQVVAAANIDNQIEVVADTAITDEDIAALATLTAAMPPNLVIGETGFASGKLYAKGVYLNDATKATFEAAAAAAGATATLEARPTATTDDAAALKQELNDLVAAEPILFDPGRDTIKAESQATLDKVAAIANKYAGVAIAIQGHTDSQGGEAGNQTLSEQRAAAVLQALVQRNVDANQLASVGFGETQLILENGVENATKSRRVVFDVATNN